MSNDTETNLTQDELATLKERADKMGITYHPSIGLEKLREKVAAHLAGAPAPAETSAEAPVANAPAADPTPTPSAPAAPAPAAEETIGQKRQRMKRDALALVRIRLTCLNPAKKEWEGEIFTVGNALIGSLTKYVPFGADEGWHVPKIMLQQLQERKCQVFTNAKTKNGVTRREGKLIKEFAIEILDPLTTAELEELARRQALSRAID